MRDWTSKEKANVDVEFDTYNKSKRQYRYYFQYTWNRSKKKKATLIMLNPSLTDEDKVDQTIDRCIKETIKRLTDCGSLIVVNLYPKITPSPSELFKSDYNLIIGKNNMEAIKKAVSKSVYVILGWGEHGAKYHMNLKVLCMLKNFPEVKLMCYGKTKYGHPIHPSRKQLKLNTFSIE